MDPNFHLIKCVDPSKSTTKIKDRFAKLTLSSRKKQQPDKDRTEDKHTEPVASTSNPSRKLFEDFLTDDESDSETDALNRIFRSKTTAKTSDDNGTKKPEIASKKHSNSVSRRLELSDPDETHCSNAAVANVHAVESEMEKLQMSPSQPTVAQASAKLFTDSSKTAEKDTDVDNLSSRLSSMGIKSKVEPPEETSDERHGRDTKLENIFKQQREKSNCSVEGAIPKRISIFTISSATTSPISVREVNDDDDGSDIVVISESEDGTEDNDDDYLVSALSAPSEPVVISEMMQNRLDAFFDNIPSLPSSEGPEKLFTNTSPETSVEKPESVPETSIEICESSEESERQEEVKAANVESPSKMNLRSATLKSFVSTPPSSPLKGHQTTSRSVCTPRKLDKLEAIEKLTSPRRVRTPRKTPTTVKKCDPPPQCEAPSIDPVPNTSKKRTSPRKSPPVSPKKPRTPRRAPTPKLGVQKSTSSNEVSLKGEPEPSNRSSKRPSGGGSSSSSEIRIEKINISATIKIKVQFNEDFVASVHTSSPSSNLPRVTESESTAPVSPSAQDDEERVETPDKLKQRSVRNADTLTTIDISKNRLSPSDAVNEHHKSNSMPSLIQAERPLSPMTPNRCQQAPPSSESKSPSACPEVVEIEMLSAQDPQNESTPVRASSSPSDNPVVEIDAVAQKLLNQLYGDEWKTPDVVKTLKKVNISRIEKPSTAVDESVMDFTKFHHNIHSDLESTRLPDISEPTKKPAGKIFKVPATDRKILRGKKETVRRPVSERKPPREFKVLTPTQRVKAICDSDSDSNANSDVDASSEESWRDVFSYSSGGSDSDEIQIPPPSRKKSERKRKKKNSSKDDLIYLDLSSDVVRVQEVNESPSANKDAAFQQRLQTLLDTHKCPEKPKLEATPVCTRTKRKLFTPRFGEEDEIPPEVPVKPDMKECNEELVKMNAPMPAMFEPINKHLEAVKTGKPVFSIKTPKTSKKNKENIPLDASDTPFKTPKPKSQSTCKKTTEKSETSLLSTPYDKYGFLQSLDVKYSKKYCHPDAIMYRDNYKTKKQELAEKLYDIYNANIFNGDMEIPLTWNKKLLNTAGRCSCSTKSGKRFCRIELSEKVLTSADRLRCTLIHEMCHAATWIYNGEVGHGATWKKWARRANCVFPELPKIGVCHEYAIEYKYTYKCTLCDAKSHAHSKSKKVENIRCAYCHGAIEVFLNKKGKDGNVLPTPVREPTGFAKFVKENYRKYKRPDIKHADVMRLLSNNFATLNVDEKE